MRLFSSSLMLLIFYRISPGSFNRQNSLLRISNQQTTDKKVKDQHSNLQIDKTFRCCTFDRGLGPLSYL